MLISAMATGSILHPALFNGITQQLLYCDGDSESKNKVCLKSVIARTVQPVHARGLGITHMLPVITTKLKL